MVSIMEEGDSDGEQAFYLTVLRAIVDAFISFQGRQSALIKARKAPLDIDADGTITGYYGTGADAVDVLARQYEQFLGEQAADRQMREAIAPHVDEEQIDLLPERLRPGKQRSLPSPLQWVRQLFGRPS